MVRTGRGRRSTARLARLWLGPALAFGVGVTRRCGDPGGEVASVWFAVDQLGVNDRMVVGRVQLAQRSARAGGGSSSSSIVAIGETLRANRIDLADTVDIRRKGADDTLH